MNVGNTVHALVHVKILNVPRLNDGEYQGSGEGRMTIDPRAYPFIAIIVILVVVACAIMIRDMIRDIMADRRRGLR